MEKVNATAEKPDKNIKKQSKPRRDYGLLLLELLTVTFGVMLGFFMTQLKEENKVEKNLDAAIKLVNSEIRDNLEEAERLFSVNTDGCLWLYKSADSLEIYKKRNKAFFNVLAPEISLFSFNKTAWETFKQMGLAGQMEFKQVAEISEIYSAISFMEKNNNQLMEVLSNSDFYDKQRIEQSFYSFLSLVNQQLNIDAEIRKTIVDYLSVYDKELLGDTINFDKLGLEFIEKAKNTNFVKNR